MIHHSMTLVLSSDKPLSLYKDASFPALYVSCGRRRQSHPSKTSHWTAKKLHSCKDPANRPLILSQGLCCLQGLSAVLQDNVSLYKGGGVCFSWNSCHANEFLATDNAQICGCSSRICGGAVAWPPPDVPKIISPSRASSLIALTAAHGAGGYRSTKTNRRALTISGSASAEREQRPRFSAGINFSGIPGRSGALPLPLTVSGKVRIQEFCPYFLPGGIFFHASTMRTSWTILDVAIFHENGAQEARRPLSGIRHRRLRHTVNKFCM